MNLEQLKKLIEEACSACDAQQPHSQEKPGFGGEEKASGGRMARTDLVTIAKDAQELVNMFGDDAELPDWVESKLTKAADYLNSVKKYIGGEIVRQQGGLMEEVYKNPDARGQGGQDIDSGVGKSVHGNMGEPHNKMVAKAKNQKQLASQYKHKAELKQMAGKLTVSYLTRLKNKFRKMGLKEFPPLDFRENVDLDPIEEREVYLYLEDATYDDGTPVEEDVEFWDDVVMEAEYQGRKVTLNKPMKGDVKKSKVYVKNEKGNVIKVNFGDPNMKIKKSNPKRRKSFRARHNCDNPGPKTKARYWSCKAW